MAISSAPMFILLFLAAAGLIEAKIQASLEQSGEIHKMKPIFVCKWETISWDEDSSYVQG